MRPCRCFADYSSCWPAPYKLFQNAVLPMGPAPCLLEDVGSAFLLHCGALASLGVWCSVLPNTTGPFGTRPIRFVGFGDSLRVDRGGQRVYFRAVSARCPTGRSAANPRGRHGDRRRAVRRRLPLDPAPSSSQSATPARVVEHLVGSGRAALASPTVEVHRPSPPGPLSPGRGGQKEENDRARVTVCLVPCLPLSWESGAGVECQQTQSPVRTAGLVQGARAGAQGADPHLVSAKIAAAAAFRPVHRFCGSAVLYTTRRTPRGGLIGTWSRLACTSAPAGACALRSEALAAVARLWLSSIRPPSSAGRYAYRQRQRRKTRRGVGCKPAVGLERHGGARGAMSRAHASGRVAQPP